MKTIVLSNIFLAFGTIVLGAQLGLASPVVINPNLISSSNNSRHATPQQKALNQEYQTDYDEGKANLQNKNYSLSEVNFQSAIDASPNGSAYLGLAEAFAGQGKITDALQAYWLLFHPGPRQSWGGSYIPKADLEYALLLDQTGHWDEALAHYNHAVPDLPRGDLKIAVGFDPGAPQPAALAAASHVGLGLYDNFEYQPDSDARAFQEYAAALQIAPNWDVANYYYGIGWQKLSPADRAKFGTAQQAKAALQKAVKVGKGNVKAAAEKALKAIG